MSIRINITGMVFERWTVENEAFFKHGEWYYECVCECGTRKNISSKSLKRGLSKSCGCLRADVRVVTHGTHGEANKTPEYRIWRAMKYRCLVDTCIDYKRYGGRGVKICSRWENSYENFLEDMGRRPPSDYSTDRINVNGDYEPSNCRWATKKEQANNRRGNRVLSYEGVSLTMAEWSDRLGVNYKMLSFYINNNKISLTDFIRLKNINYAIY